MRKLIRSTELVHNQINESANEHPGNRQEFTALRVEKMAERRDDDSESYGDTDSFKTHNHAAPQEQDSMAKVRRNKAVAGHRTPNQILRCGAL
jgi:hypothetical protein